MIKKIIYSGKKVFLDAKMFDIGKTVEEGVARVADYLVVGRPIIEKADPAASARRIIADMDQ